MVRQDGRQVRLGLDWNCRSMEVLKLQNEAGTAEVNWLVLNYNHCSLVSRPS